MTWQRDSQNLDRRQRMDANEEQQVSRARTVLSSRENRRFLIISVALMGVFCSTLVGLVAIYHYGTTSSTPVMATVIGFAGITINQLLAMLRDEQATRLAEDSRVMIHSKLNQAVEAANKTKEVTESAVQVAEDVAKKITGTPLPTNREEMAEMIDLIVERACTRIIDKTIEKALNKEPPNVQT